MMYAVAILIGGSVHCLSPDRLALLRDERYPLAAKYDPDWVFENKMGSPCLMLCEGLSRAMRLRPGMRVLDMGCGRALTSIFLAREFGVQVYANDLWVPATENWRRICEAGVGRLVTPIHAEAHALPYADGFFDASICINSFQFYGTSDTYIEDHFARLVKPGGMMAFALPGLHEEFADDAPAGMATFSTWENLNWFHTAEWWQRKFLRSRQCSRIDVDDFAGDGVRLMTQWARIMDKTPAEIEENERYYVWLRLLAERRGESCAQQGMAGVAG